MINNAGPGTNHFPVDLEIAKSKQRLNVYVLERYETETLAPSGLSVQHDGCINDLAELGEKLAHRLRSDTAWETADKELSRTLVLLAGDRTLGVNLHVDRW